MRALSSLDPSLDPSLGPPPAPPGAGPAPVPAAQTRADPGVGRLPGPVLEPAGAAPRRWRPLVLPLAALAALAAGGLAWAVAGPPGARRVWLVGLLLAGAPAVWQTAREMLRGHFASDVVAMLAILAAVSLGEPVAGLVVVLMQTGGQALERYAEGRASAAVRALEAAAPRTAHRICATAGARGAATPAVEDLPVDAVAVGDLLLVRPGELLPCDVVVTDGRSHVDTSRLTGEPVPVLAGPGTALSSGSANLEGALTVRATALARESQYARIVELVRTAQAGKAPLQRLADRYAVWFTPVTLVVCALAWLASGDATRVLAVLVVATPCPLILATPIAIIGGINRAAARQIVVRHGGALEQLAGVTTAVFDKTGTLTVGRPEVVRVEVAEGWTPAAVLRLAGAVEQRSGHLLARSTVSAAEATLAEATLAEAALAEATLAEGTRALPHAAAVEEIAGRGVGGVVEGRHVLVGARRFVLERLAGGVDAAAAVAALDARFAADEGLRAYVAADGRVVGALAYADRLRPEAGAVIAAMRALGVRRTILLSGDHAPNVARVAAALGLTEARGDLLPADKVAAVRALRARGERVVMVGDGTNDAPALSGATVGIALAGSAGHGGGITAEAADVVILADALDRVPEAIRISRRTLHVARQSLAAGLGLSAVAMVVAALGHVPPVGGALLQEVIDVAVILNALRASRR